MAEILRKNCFTHQPGPKWYQANRKRTTNYLVYQKRDREMTAVIPIHVIFPACFVLTVA